MCVGDGDGGGAGGVSMRARRWRRLHRDHRVRNSVGKGGKCERVKSIPAGAPCCVLTSPQVVLRHNEVQEPLSRGKLWISSKGRPCLDFHFWREHIGGCRKDGLGAGDRGQGQWVRSLLSPSEG